jgi:hypothetical protein
MEHMGFRFSRRISVLAGVRLNISKSGISTSLGMRGGSVTIGKRGVRMTVGMPGTGISYSSTNTVGFHPIGTRRGASPAPVPWQHRMGWALLVLLLLGAAGGVIEMLARLA